MEKLPNGRVSLYATATALGEIGSMVEDRLRRAAAAWVFLGGALLAGGCQTNGSGASAEASETPKVTQSDLLAYCPPVVLRQGTTFYTTYERGAEGDNGKVVYQNSITDVTRTCSRENGTLNMTIAAAGRVVPGPSGGPGTVTLPIRVAVTNGDEVLYSKIHQYQVQVGGSSATQFVFTDPAASFADPGTRTIRAYIGFDAGEPKEQADGEEASQ